MLSAPASHALALVVLAAFAVGVLVWMVVFARSLPYSPGQTFLYLLNLSLARILWRAQVSGPLPVAPGQGAVVVCNHRSPVDPCFIALTTLRVVNWMVAKEYWRNPLFAYLFRLTRAIPVSRGGIDTAATKAAIRAVAEGEVVGLFPEGRINRTSRLLLPGRPGAALIALKARAPVIPCYVSGSPFDGTMWGFFFMPSKVRLEVGRPIDLSAYFGREKERGVLEEVTRRLLVEIAALAGASDFQPELAGRFYRPQ